MLAFVWLVAIRICIDVGGYYRRLAIQNLSDKRIAVPLQGKAQTNRRITPVTPLLLLTGDLIVGHWESAGTVIGGYRWRRMLHCDGLAVSGNGRSKFGYLAGGPNL